jgi:hypothetical protein
VEDLLLGGKGLLLLLGGLLGILDLLDLGLVSLLLLLVVGLLLVGSLDGLLQKMKRVN